MMFRIFYISTHIPAKINVFSVSKVHCGPNITEHGRDVKPQNTLGFEDIPGPQSYPVIGTLHKYLPFIGDYNAESLDKNAWLNWCRYGALAREVPLVNVLHVFDPEHIESVFRQPDRLPARRSHVAMYHYRMSKPHVYNTGGLLSTNGPDWWRLRSSFQKNFTSPQSVKGHIKNTDLVVREFVHWMKDTNISQDKDFLPYLNRLNLEVIGKVAFNESFNSFSQNEQDEESRSSRVISAAFGSNSGIMKLDKGFLWKIFQTPLYRKLAESQGYLEKVSIQILIDKLKFFENEKCAFDNSLLGSFLAQDNLDFKDIVGMMVDILMAAIDTTAFSTSFILYHLARNPEAQSKAYSEIKALLPNNDSDITAETLTKAVYVRSCVKESLRLNPVSIGVGRLLQNDIVIGGYMVPKGTVVVTQNMIASRLPQFVRDPLSFKPERWQRDSPGYENIHPFTSLPFGFGSRACIARRFAEQNMNIFILRILREFEIKWMGGDLGVRTHLINKPDKPLTFSFTQRTE